MSRSTLLPGADELSLDCIKAHRNAITVVVHAARPAVKCPGCDSISRRIHSHCERKLADLPWNGVAVHLHVRTRKFFCMAKGCGQRIFTERLPDTVVPHGRRTRRLKQVLDWFALALGGAAGSRSARKIGIVASGDTLLRQLRRMHVTTNPTPRVHPTQAEQIAMAMRSTTAYSETRKGISSQEHHLPEQRFASVSPNYNDSQRCRRLQP